MNLQWTSIDDIIVDLEATHNIKSSAYINKLPLWITRALANYRVFIPMECVSVDITIESDNVIYIPYDVKAMTGISYKGVFMGKGTSSKAIGHVPPSVYSDMISVTGFQMEITKDEDGNIISKRKTDYEIPIIHTHDANNYRYFVNNSRVITLDFGGMDKEGDVIKLYYIRLPHDHNSTTGQWTPMIPDNEVVKENITWFILRNLLYSGYKHPILNLGSGMPYLNPAKMYDNTRPAARSQFLAWDRSDYGIVKNLMTTFIHSYGDSSTNLQQH